LKNYFITKTTKSSAGITDRNREDYDPSKKHRQKMMLKKVRKKSSRHASKNLRKTSKTPLKNGRRAAEIIVDSYGRRNSARK